MSELSTGPTPATPGAPATRRDPGLVLDLGDDAALDPSVTGGKAAALARAARSGIDTLPGVVLTTAFSAAVDRGVAVTGHPALREAYEALAPGAALIARSSSVVEDTAGSSMAGQFATVADITGPEDLAASVQVVLDSRVQAGAGSHPMAVLLQPMLEPRWSGVLFGVDPVTGRSDRRVVSAVEGSPEPLVSGSVAGARYVLDPSGKVVDHEGDPAPDLPPSELARLSALADRVAGVFGAPQDVEWAIGDDGRLWLLQSRPVTSEIRGVPDGPIFGPGPVAETFPARLTELEQDLWVPPLREAVRASVLLAGTASRRAVAASPVVVTIDGSVAIDLKLAGDLVTPPSLWQKLNPVPAVRRLRGAWRVGRLRAALPLLSEHLLDRTDTDLRTVPVLDELSSRQLVDLLHRSRDVLRALHAHEILMGTLVEASTSRLTGVSVALRVLGEARADGLDDEEIIERAPVVLALTAPRVARRSALPAAPTSPVPSTPIHDDGDSDSVLREALRLRIRWVQELSGRAAWTLGERLAATEDLPDVELVRHLHLDDLDAIVTQRASLVPALVIAHRHGERPALPARFRVSDTGHAIRVQCTTEVGGGTGAGGGSGQGPVTHDAVAPPEGSVLVTTTLAPGLGPLLSRLSGIVAETGSVLSHLAILAREAGIPTIVSYAEAVSDLPEGTMVLVDGDSGRVTVLDDGDPE